MAIAIVKIVEVPDDNPIRWVKVDDFNDTNYQTLQGLFARQQEYWNAQTNYYQKYTFWDFIGVQIALAGLYTFQEAALDIEVLDCNGKVIGSEHWTNKGQLPGNKYHYNGTDYNLTSYNFKTQFSKFTLEEGIYWLRIRLAYVTGGVQYFDYLQSEPLLIRAEHRGTRLIEYISHTNKHNVFYTSGIFFHLRVEGEIVYEQPKNISIQYDDQKMNPRLQSATAYRDITLRMGYPNGLPMWMLDKVNRAYNNDYVLTDKVRYVRAGEVEVGTKVPRWLKYGGQLKIREYDNDAAGIKASTAPFTLYASSFPYCIYELAISNSISGDSKLIFSGYEVRNQQEEDAFLAMINNSALAAQGLSGKVFKALNGFVMYENGPGEFYDTSDTIRFTKWFALNYSKTPAAIIKPNIWFLTSRISVVFKHNYEVYNGGDGSTTNYALWTQAYTYPSSDSTANIRVYHDDHVKQISINESNNPNASLISITYGNIPNTLEYLWLFYCPLPNGIDMSGFPTTMKEIIVRYSSIFFPGLVNFNKNWVNLEQIALNNNFLSTAMVDSMFNQHYNANGYSPPANGRFLINNQTPAAPPTAASLAARNKLIAAGWQVITD